MSPRSNQARLSDISAACAAIESYLARDDTDDDILHDAIRARLIEIGEAVKDLDADVLNSEPAIAWSEIARMRDQLTHRYFDTTHAIVRTTAEKEIPELAAAVARLQVSLPKKA